MQTESKKHSFYFGAKRIEFDLIQSNRKTLGITVKPDSSVYVRSPINKTIDDVLIKVKNKAPWILKQIEQFDEIRPIIYEKEYVSGESLYYLGRQYRLKVLKVGSKNSVKMVNGFILVRTENKDSMIVKQLLDKWYLELSRKYYEKKVKIILDILTKYEISMPTIKIRKMKTRWGSCSRNGNISLNIHLIKAPSHCIEYVIMHEFCHLKYFNHGKDYYLLLNKVMPDWESRKKRLEKVIV